MSTRFRLLTEADVKSVLTMDDLIDTMASALQRFSTGRVAQPVRTVIPVDGDHALFAVMPAFVGSTQNDATNFGGAGPRTIGGAKSDSTSSGGAGPWAGSDAALGTKLVTVFGANAARGLHTHLASILLLDPETGALLAVLDGRYITESRTAAVSAVSSRLLARSKASSLAIIGSGVQAHSHLEALSRVHSLRHVAVWSPNKEHRERFAAAERDGPAASARDVTRASASRAEAPQVRRRVRAVDHAGEAVVGADIIVLVTSSPAPVIESGWVKPGAHVISVGACRPTQREMDPVLVARARLFVDSRAAALVESGDVVMGMQEGRFGAGHIVAEIGELVNGAPGRQNDADVTIFKSLGMAVEDVTAADLAYRRAVERGIGQELSL
jgi:ornithine cyclodeaminase/alanine dehydrogenase-like protein (mu-crystallin family)